MGYDWLDAYCRAKPYAKRDVKAEWDNAIRFLVGGKIFGMQCVDNRGKTVFNLKLEPAFGAILRKQFPNVTPGYHMNKLHWNSLDLDGDVPVAVVKDMVDQAYTLVFASLTKKTKKELADADYGDS